MSRVNHELKSCFIHIPKVAGCSLSNSEWNRGNGHKTIADFEVELGMEALTSFFKWSFVRNPWERIVSAYEDCPEIWSQVPTFRDFIDCIYAHRTQLDGIMALRFTNCPWLGLPVGRLHFMPQHLLMRNRIGEYHMDFVGRYESLQEDFDKVQDKLGVKRRTLPHHNQRANKKGRRKTAAWRELYDAELVYKVGKIYAEDAAIFQYFAPRAIGG